MYSNYNMNQLSLDITTSYIPEKNNTAWFINELVETLEIKESYLFGRPRQYDLSAMLKLVLFAYTRSVFSSRKIAQLAEESLPARWLTQEMMPSYRTIARFRISNELEGLINQGLEQLTTYLRQQNMIDDAIFIDGTKILADANKFSFVWKKNTIRFDAMNREATVSLMNELKEAYSSSHIPDGSNLSLDMVDEVLTRLEFRLEELEKQIETTPKISPNPAKQERRSLKSTKRKLAARRAKMLEHQKQFKTFGKRNSYSKTDYDATFMRVKEDHMKNGQLKPAYNLQIATSKQFVVGYDVYQNPTDTKTLIPFLEKMNLAEKDAMYIVADAGYGSESNYQYLEDKLSQHTSLIPYGTMLKENSKKWQSDDKKVMNWFYDEKEDYYIDPKGVRFNFNTYRKRTDKDGFTRDFKEYVAEKYDENREEIPGALTAKGYKRKIMINPSWEYYKAKQRDLLSTKETGKIYAKRKIDVEPVFGRMKASLGFTRFSVRGLGKVLKETGIVSLALNMMKLASWETQKDIENRKNPKQTKNNTFRPFRIFYFRLITLTYVTASFFFFLND